jgi:hypothetical protein
MFDGDETIISYLTKILSPVVHSITPPASKYPDKHLEVFSLKSFKAIKSSQWMVIHSIQGNCPSNVTGNLAIDSSGLGAADFQYTIPSGISVPNSQSVSFLVIRRN